MAREASVIVGSGIAPLKKVIPVNDITGERHLRGTSVVILNPEDGSAGGSGLVTAITLDTTTVQVPSEPLAYRRAISICNNSAEAIIYIGFDPNVTTGAGWPITPGATISLDVNGQVLIWGVSSDPGADVRILELS